MPDIFHDFPVFAPPERVFAALSSPAGLDAWWTQRASGDPAPGATYEFWFGPSYDWRAVVRDVSPDAAIEWELTRADRDWLGTRVGFRLSAEDGYTHVRFHHTGWPEHNDHYRTSCFCWAMYLRLLRRYVEFGEVVPYDRRLDA